MNSKFGVREFFSRLTFHNNATRSLRKHKGCKTKKRKAIGVTTSAGTLLWTKGLKNLSRESSIRRKAPLASNPPGLPGPQLHLEPLPDLGILNLEASQSLDLPLDYPSRQRSESSPTPCSLHCVQELYRGQAGSPTILPTLNYGRNRLQVIDADSSNLSSQSGLAQSLPDVQSLSPDVPKLRAFDSSTSSETRHLEPLTKAEIVPFSGLQLEPLPEYIYTPPLPWPLRVGEAQSQLIKTHGTLELISRAANAALHKRSAAAQTRELFAKMPTLYDQGHTEVWKPSEANSEDENVQNIVSGEGRAGGGDIIGDGQGNMNQFLILCMILTKRK